MILNHIIYGYFIKMIANNTLIPVIPVQTGESTTFPCARSNNDHDRGEVHWYKQSVGDNLKLVVTLRKHTLPQFAPEFSSSRWKVNSDDRFTNLTILTTIQEDEGIYHCAIFAFYGVESKWSGTYLIVKGNNQSTASHSVHPGESQTLHCSVFSDSENKTCSGDPSVFWFKPGSDKSHPDIIYTDGNRPDECEKRSDTQKSCVYHSSKTFNSSDAGNYYCAVATCGQILFGNGTSLSHSKQKSNGTCPLDPFFPHVNAPHPKIARLVGGHSWATTWSHDSSFSLSLVAALAQSQTLSFIMKKVQRKVFLKAFETRNNLCGC
uniref:Ig-like domain-containing protein n=1 Tax=Amphiprion percula TaxID=161767 RepID=A0A3P8RW49_AMPPE